MNLTMLDLNPFTIPHPDYTVCQLTRQDSDRLQALFERCTDFFELTTGQPPNPTAAEAEFGDVPASKTPEDLHVFGLCQRLDTLTGAMIAVQDYPAAATWWISTMLIDPADRSQGVGSAFYQGFERWLAAQGVTGIELCAIAPNLPGRRFWQRLGFAEIRQTPPRAYGQKTPTVHVYRRQLNIVAKPPAPEESDVPYP